MPEPASLHCGCATIMAKALGQGDGKYYSVDCPGHACPDAAAIRLAALEEAAGFVRGCAYNVRSQAVAIHDCGDDSTILDENVKCLFEVAEDLHALAGKEPHRDA